MQVEVVKASREHVPLLLAGMSSAVVGELKTLYPATELAARMCEAIEHSAEATSFFVDGKIIAMVGITTPTALSDIAYPWLLPHSENLGPYKYEFLAASKRWTQYQITRYSTLQNVVSAKNLAALKWLKWLGFELGPVMKIKGQPFRPYRMERK